MEIWKNINWFVCNYEVSNTGKVRNKKNGKLLKPDYHHQVTIIAQHPHKTRQTQQKRISVNRLVASHFIPEFKEQHYVVLIDKSKGLGVKNLKIMTRSEMNKQQRKQGFRGETMQYVRLSDGKIFNGKKELEKKYYRGMCSDVNVAIRKNKIFKGSRWDKISKKNNPY